MLGGGLAEGADLYLDPIQRWFTELLYSPELRPHPDLAFAEHGERAGRSARRCSPGSERADK